MQETQRLRFDPWVQKIPWRRKQQPTPGSLPGESQGQRSLVRYSPRGSRDRHNLSDLAQTAACQASLAWKMRLQQIKQSMALFYYFFLRKLNFSKRFYWFIYFWMCWVLVAAHGLFLVLVSRGQPLVVVCGFLIVVSSLVAEKGL